MDPVIQSHRRLLFCFLLCVFSFSSRVEAQADTGLVLLSADTVQVAITPHSPTRASVYSAILPGLGQIYNRKYWKVPIVYAGFGTLVYFVYYNTRGLNRYNQAYLDFTDSIPGTDSYLDLISKSFDPSTFDPILHPETYNSGLAESFKSLLKNNKDYYRRNRELSYIGMAAWYLLVMIDASVDAHFYDFDISEDLSLELRPYVSHPASPVSVIGLGATLHF